MPTDIGLPDMSEYVTMGNCLRMGKSFDEAVRDEGLPDTPLFRQRYAALKQSIDKMLAEGKTPDWDFD